MNIKITEWMNEDELNDEEMYATLFPLSKVDGVRLFPKVIEVEENVIDRNIKIHFPRGITRAVLNIMLQDMEKMINEKYCYLTEKEMKSKDYQEYLLKLVIKFV